MVAESIMGVFLIGLIVSLLLYLPLISGFKTTNRNPDEFNENLVNEARPYTITNAIIIAFLTVFENSFSDRLICFVVISGISFILSTYLVMVDFKILPMINIYIDDKSKNVISMSVKVVQVVLLISALTYQIITNHFSSTVVLLTLFPILLIMMLTTVILGVCLIYREKKRAKQ